jgi:hypothetical protein
MELIAFPDKECIIRVKKAESIDRNFGGLTYSVGGRKRPKDPTVLMITITDIYLK